MGYKRGPKQYNLKFADEEYEGFECRLKALNLDDFLHLTSQAQGAGAEQANARPMLEMLAGNLVAWNLEDDAGAVPAVLAQCVTSGLEVPESGRCAAHAEESARCRVTGLLGQDIGFAMDIIGAWMQAMGGVSGPLRPTSSDGKPSLEGSMPMEIQSTEPAELTYANTILGLCDRFHCLPSQLKNEDAELLRLVRIQAMGNPERTEGGDSEWPT